jgi:hypothetical protein
MAQDTKGIDRVYLDFLGFIPMMTHFFCPETLNDRFRFLLKPDEYCKKYEYDFAGNDHIENLRMFVHYLCQMRTLTGNETREHFWTNLFSGSLRSHLNRMTDAGLYPYTPYILRPNFKLSINKKTAYQIRGIKHRVLARSRLSTQIHMFPHGVGAARIRASFNTPLSVKELVRLLRSFLEDEVFDVGELRAKKLDLNRNKNLTMQEVFEALDKCLWKTFYVQGVDDVDKRMPPKCESTMIFLNTLKGIELSDEDVGAITSLSENPFPEQIQKGKDQRIKGQKEAEDVLAFGGHSIALFWTLNTDITKLRFFRANYSNVIEFSLLQHFWFSMINKRLIKERQSFLSGEQTKIRKLSSLDVEGINASFLEYKDCLRGGHQALFKLVADTTMLQSQREQFKMAFDEVWLASQLVDQINEMQTTVETIVTSSSADTFANLHSASATEVFNKGVDIKSGIMSAVTTLVDAQADPFPDAATIYKLRVALQKNIASFPQYLESYHTLVENLLQDKTKIESDADQKRQAGVQVPDKAQVSNLVESATTMLKDANNLKKNIDVNQAPKTFWEKAKPYIGLVVGAATAVLKAVAL